MARIQKTAALGERLTDPVGKNLFYLLKPTGQYDNVRQLAIAMNGGKENESQIRRVRRAMYAESSDSAPPINMSTLVEIAKGLRKIGYSVEAWQLMVPDSNPANPRILMPVDPAQRKFWEAVEELRHTVGKTEEKQT